LTFAAKPDDPTLTLAVALVLPLVAVIVYGPPVELLAVNTPEAEIEPPPLTVHENAGCDDKLLPNWSVPIAVNCVVDAGATDAFDGLTDALVSTWFTLTVIALVTV
jgi:hypothetical protein